MFTKLFNGLHKSASDLTTSATGVYDAMSCMIGTWVRGEPVTKAQVRKLVQAGFDTAQIASFFGVAERVLNEFMADEDAEELETPDKGV